MGVMVRDSTWNRGSFSLLSCKPALGSHSYWTCSIPDKVGTGQTPASTTPLMTAMGSHKWMSTRPLVLETVMEFQRWTQDTNPQPLRTAMESHIPLHRTGDSYGVPEVDTGYQPTTPEDSYGVPHSSPCPTYTTTTIPPPTYHQKDKPKDPFPDVLGFLKSIPEGIHNIFKASPNPPDDYGVPCTVPQSSYSPPEVTDYTPPVVDDYGPPEVPGYTGDHGGDISINERGLVPDGKA